jgi:hypothetical protein
MSFQRLVRFVNEQGTTLYGDLKTEAPADLTGVEVDVLEGDVQSGFKSTGRKDKIQQLLCPLPSIPMVVCIGLNYQKHANEANVGHLPPTRGHGQKLTFYTAQSSPLPSRLHQAGRRPGGTLRRCLDPPRRPGHARLRGRGDGRYRQGRQERVRGRCSVLRAWLHRRKRRVSPELPAPRYIRRPGEIFSPPLCPLPPDSNPAVIVLLRKVLRQVRPHRALHRGSQPRR